ncbi:hypothetical protein BGW38_006124, partial [Lunasporangiospora selenospora]
ERSIIRQYERKPWKAPPKEPNPLMQPTLRHRTWMKRQKATNLTAHPRPSTTGTESTATPMVNQSSTSSTEGVPAEYLSIGKIESSLPPIRGANTSFADHIEFRIAYEESLDRFYKMSKKALKHEFTRLTDSLPRIVRGSIGEKKEEENK